MGRHGESGDPSGTGLIAQLATLAFLSAAHAGLSDAELLELRAEILPMVEQAAGRRFTAPPAVDTRTHAGIGDVIEAENEALAGRFYPHLGPRALHAFGRGDPAGTPVFGKFSLINQTVYIRSDIARAWRLRRKAGGLDARETETEENLAACVLAHELAHALQVQHSALDSVVQGRDMERLAAWNALAEGHAVQITRQVCAARGTPELMARLEPALGFDGPGPGPGSGELQSSHEAGLRFVEAQPDIWAVFAALPTDTRMIHRPDTYQPGVSVGAFPGWPTLEASARDLLGGDPSLLMRDRAGFQTLQPLIRRSEAGEQVLDALASAHIGTVSQGARVVEVMAVEMASPAAAEGLLQAFREQEAWRLRPERRWRSATFVEPPVDSGGPAGGWHSRFTVRPSQGGDLGAVTAVWAATRGRWVVRVWMSQITPEDARCGATLHTLLTALVAASP